jgi:indolepyruvate ferredoxin oxidoreductase beta subunit
MKSLNFFLAGVGGQGTLLASNILAEVGVRAHYDVKKSEVHGMAQRGGAVSSHVRWGSQIHSPLIGLGEADFVIAFERLESLRHVAMLRPGGRVLINDYAIIPVTVTAGDATYPSHEQIAETLAQVTSEVIFVPGVEVAQELGNARANNVVILGALSQRLDVGIAVWEQVIAERVPARYRELNLKAFSRGRDLAG